MSIGSKIKEQREIKGITQETLAEEVGITANYLGVLERGDKLPKLATFIKIANALKVSADVLLVDVLSVSGSIRATYLETSISRLSETEQKKVYEILEILTRDV